MNEYFVEWALLREKNYLQECIKLGIGHLLLISIRNVYIFNTITRT